MPIVCRCPTCERTIRVKDSLAGATIRCPDCSAAVPVRRADPSLAESVARAFGTSERQTTNAPVKLAGKARNDTHEPDQDLNASQINRKWVAGAVVGGLSVLVVVAVLIMPGSGTAVQEPQPVEQSSVQVPTIVASATPAPSPVPAAPSSSTVASPVSPTGSDLSSYVQNDESVVGADIAMQEPPVVPESKADAGTQDPPVPPPTASGIESTATESAEVLSVNNDSNITPAQSVAPVSPPIADTDASRTQATTVASLLKTACYRCHGENGTNEGGVNYVTNLEKVREFLVRPGAPNDSLLMKRTASVDPETMMPPKGETPGLTEENIGTIRDWILSGAKIPASSTERSFVSESQIVSVSHSDLMSLPERSRRFIRYFSLTHLYNGGASDDELETYRLAFSKLINSLSWGRKIILPHRANPEGTILRVDIRDLNWGPETWDQIIDVNPYPFRPDIDAARQCYEQAATPEPWVRADWFVFKASRPPLYHQILRIPETEGELELVIHVDALANIEQEKVVRAGFNRSGVSRNNRLIERHEIAYGAYWKSYDFAANTGQQNLFDYPSGPTGEESFAHDGGELIFNLPNGLQGFMLTDATGQRLESGPTSIVSDPATHDRTVINGVSCFSCHFAGIIHKEDEIRPFLELNAKSFENVDYLKSIYPGQDRLDQYYQSDRQSYLQALAQIGIANTSRAGEPISSMSQRFQTEITARIAAAEFGLTEPEFHHRLESNNDLPRSLGVLRVAGGTLKRDAFTEIFREAAELLRIDPQAEGAEKRAALSRDVVPEVKFANLRIEAVDFTADGSRAVLCTNSSNLLLVDTKTGETLGTALSSRDLSWKPMVRVSPQGNYVLTGGQDGVIQVWEVSTNNLMKLSSEFSGHVVEGHGIQEIPGAVVSADESTVFSSSSNHQVHAWSLKSGKIVRSFPELFRGRASAWWISNDGREVMTTDGTELKSTTTRGSKQPDSVALEGRARHAAFSPNGKLLALDSDDGIRLLDTKTGKQVSTIPVVTWPPLTSLSFCDKGRYLLVRQPSQLLAWRTADQQPVPIANAKKWSLNQPFVTTANNDVVAWIENEGFSHALRMQRLSAPQSTEPRASPGTAARVTPSKARWKAGDKAEIEYGSRWAPVTILKINPNGTIRIHWDGWSDSWDEDVENTRLRKPN